MKRLPVFPVAEDDGIPIPGGNYHLDIPEEVYPLFEPKTLDDEQYIILAISGVSSPCSHDLEMIPGLIHEIGALCTVESASPLSDFFIVELDVIARVAIKNFHFSSVKKLPAVDYVLVDDRILDDEKENIDHIDNLMNILRTKTLIDPMLINAIDAQSQYPKKLDLLARTVLNKEEDRVQYMQLHDPTEKMFLIVAGLGDLTDDIEANEQPPPPPKFLKRLEPKFKDTNKKPKVSVVPATVVERLEKTELPAEVRSHVQREIDKLETLSRSSNEHSTTLDYLTWVASVPWGTYSYTKFDLKGLTTQLDKSHHGLEDVKRFLLEHLTIEQVRGGSTGTVLCFVGPPGTGKTSIGKEIAKASNRQLQQLALGGITDEAEIRGHRRTYLGSRPGRLITSLKKAGTLDPLFLFDEIDKISTSRGDPASALLEVLDQEQNDQFIDRYLEVPVDLSHAMFICTANYYEQIPPPLRDRMEFIFFRNYTYDERRVILEDYMLPEALVDYQMEEYPVEITSGTLDQLAKASGVRQMEKKLRKLLRSAATDIHVADITHVKMDEKYVQTALANDQQDPESRKPKIGFGR